MRRRAGVFVVLAVLGVLLVGSTAHAEHSSFHVANFRLSIDGLDATPAGCRISKVEDITFKQTTRTDDVPNLQIFFDAQELGIVVHVDPNGDLVAEIIVPPLTPGDHAVTLAEENTVKVCGNATRSTCGPRASGEALLHQDCLNREQVRRTTW